ncbi:MAG: hypothetical protein IPI12_07505 [Ignavibacteriales bacterium]|mgnify:CR=1 FL=1|jgi:hypothetical protein|nr:hypothetical protein [Ignavibacteriales bacterium]MBK8664070.1 hypothetical protein [Ignavibacteriales bacterium]MCC6637263.1 hypothetical protein [Ignavibacteriaceae bacterium]
MTTEEMITRIRSILDEREAGFWSDAEVLNALNDAQDEVVNYCLFVFTSGGVDSRLPLLLTPLQQEVVYEAVTGLWVTLPEGFMYPVSVKCAISDGEEEKPCVFKSPGANHFYEEDNHWLKPGEKNLYCYITGGKLNFSTTINNGTVKMLYLKKADRITNENDCLLPDNASGAIIAAAASQLLEKDKQYEESGALYAMFTAKIEKLILL